MNIFIGPESIDKTTTLIQYTYDHLSKVSDSYTYAIFITSKSSKYLIDLFFGKYDSVSKYVLDRIYIKFIEKHEDLIQFFTELLFVDPQDYPSMISIDKVNILSTNEKNYSENVQIYKSIIRLHSLLEQLSSLTININFSCCLDLDLDDKKMFIYNMKVMEVLGGYFKENIYKISKSVENQYLINFKRCSIEIDILNKIRFVIQLLDNVPEEIKSIEERINDYYSYTNEEEEL